MGEGHVGSMMGEGIAKSLIHQQLSSSLAAASSALPRLPQSLHIPCALMKTTAG